MKPNSQPWNSLGEHFNTQKAAPDPGVVANFENAWPLIQRALKGLPARPRVLDFGCGTGALCDRLVQAGCQVTGIDPSTAMIATARKNFPERINFTVGGAEDVSRLGQFDLIVSLMVLQFVPDLASTLSVLASALSKQGAFVCSVHSERYIRWPENSHTRFREIVDAPQGATAIMTLSGVDVPTFVRSEEEYRAALAGAGLVTHAVHYSEPYADGTPPKFLVMATRKAA